MIEEEEDCVTMEDFLCMLQQRDKTGGKGREKRRGQEEGRELRREDKREGKRRREKVYKNLY